MLVFDDGRGPGLFCSINSPSGPSAYIGRWDGHSWTGLGQGLQYYGSGSLRKNLAVYDAGRGPELNVVDQIDSVGGGLPSFAVGTWRNLQPGITRLCPGDRTFAYCPCFSFGANDRGCPNSFDPGGADLSASGVTQDDSLTLVASAMPPNTATLLFQGDSINASSIYFAFGTTGFGDGLRCASGHLLRLYTKLAVNSQITVPDVGDLSLRARASMLHDPLPAGASRVYQAWYRDPAPAFCDPAATWNVTNAIRVVW
jgi:hypothetical protein